MNKRDLRSVDEIQQDIRAGRGLVHAKASVQEDRERAEERRQAAMERVKMKREGYDADDYSSDPRQYSHSKSHAPSPPPPASSSLAHKKPPVSSSQGNAATLKHNAAATGINDIFFETDPKLAQQIGTKPRTPLPSNNNHNDNTRRHVNGSSSSKPNQASSSSSNKKSKQKVEKRPPPSKQSASAAAGRKRRESTESSSEESLQPPPKSKKKKLNVDEALLDEDYAKKNISSIIGAMFGYDRRR